MCCDVWGRLKQDRRLHSVKTVIWAETKIRFIWRCYWQETTWFHMNTAGMKKRFSGDEPTEGALLLILPEQALDVLLQNHDLLPGVR